MCLRQRRRLGRLHLGDLVGVDARDAHALCMYLKHDAHGVAFSPLKNGLQHEDDEVHRREIVVVNQDPVERRRLELLFAFTLDDDRFVWLTRSSGHNLNDARIEHARLFLDSKIPAPLVECSSLKPHHFYDLYYPDETGRTASAFEGSGTRSRHPACRFWKRQFKLKA